MSVYAVHAVEMTFESIDVGRPELPERSEPIIDFLQGCGPEAIETALGIDRGFNETGLTQNAQML